MEVWQAISYEFSGSWVYLVRIIIAGLCGSLIGLERTKRQKEAGIRTHVIVALGSALMMVVSKYGFYDVVVTQGISLDASRIAANIITGVSFLGAGVIFFKNDTIKGLTTAAGIWATSGVGLAIGAGMYSVGVISTLLIIIIHLILHHPLTVAESFVMNTITVTVYNEENVLEKLKNEFINMDFQIKSCNVIKHKNDTITVKLLLRHSVDMDWTTIMEFVQKNTYVKSIGT